MTSEVELAIDEIRKSFPDNQVTVEPEGQGGAYVLVHDLPIGEQHTPSTTWIGSFITFSYPYADVYPHFIDSAVRRVDSRGHAGGFSGPIQWQGRSALQISRRSNHWNPTTDTAAMKLIKVLQWIREQ